MKYLAALTSIILIIILVSCMIVKDSVVVDSNLYKEVVSGTKDGGIDLRGECNQSVNECDGKE